MMRRRHALLSGLAIILVLAAPAGFAETTSGGGSFADLWEMAKAAGPFGTCLLLVIWQLERRDRMRLQGERDELLERVLTSINEQTDALRDTKRAIERSG